MGVEGPRGFPGVKGDIGFMGRRGEKGSTGLKGNKGDTGSTGLQEPKRECIVDPKISIYPVSQEVFINKPAIFYCWVDGQTAKQITWSKLGGVLASDITVKGSVLLISNVRQSHSGSYLCTTVTDYGTLRAIGTLGVKELPVFTRKAPAQVSVSPGSDLELCCAATGSPQPAIEWSRGKRSIDVTLYQNGCLTMKNVKEEDTGKYVCRATNSLGFVQLTTEIFLHAASCQTIKENKMRSNSGKYKLTINSYDFWVYCDMTSDGKGWSLIARFSNNDNKNWMRDDGNWWYDRQVATGTTANPFINTDMISPAFWLVSGREFKITRSDDPSHTPLLQTTGNCLAGQTFRSKITSYGDFRNGKVWASDQCLGSCTVQYGGQYKSTDGFQQAECSGDIRGANNIGVWCDWQYDGSVMMIGGGGNSCWRADHGIGITETDAASFVEKGSGETEYDFGYDANTGNAPSQSYSLNLWIR